MKIWQVCTWVQENLSGYESLLGGMNGTSADDNLNEIKARFNELVDELPEVIDNLQSQSSVDALSANQGRVIQNKIVELEEKVNSIQTIVNKLNSNLGDLTVEVVDEW